MSDEVANAIRDALGDEDGNIADAIAGAGRGITKALTNLGNADAATPMGGLEGLGRAIVEAAGEIRPGVNDLATAMERIAGALERIASAVEEGAFTHDE